MEKLKELKKMVMWQAEAVNKELEKTQRQNSLFSNLPERKEAAEILSMLAQIYISILGAEECHRADVLYKKIDELSSELAKYKKEESGCELLQSGQ